MTIKLRPGNRQIEDVKEVANLSRSDLTHVIDRFESIPLDGRGSKCLRPEHLVNVAAERIGHPSAAVLVRLLLSLVTLARRTATSTSEIITAISEHIEGGWSENIEQFERLLKTSVVRLTANAIELSYDYSNLVRQIRIITDIRPLFDDGADRVEAAVISHTLRVNYDSADGEHELSLVLDIADIESLRASCDRAIKKTETARGVLKDIPTIVSGQKEES